MDDNYMNDDYLTKNKPKNPEIESQNAKHKRLMQSAMKLNGFVIRSEFAALIITTLENAGFNFETDFESVVRSLCENLDKHVEPDRCIDKAQITRAIDSVINSGKDEREITFGVIEAFAFPHLYYDLETNMFLISPKKRVMLAGAEKKSKLFTDRYQAIKNRTENSLIPKLGEERTSITIHTVDFLLTVPQRILKNELILGSLFHDSSDKYFLEDASGMIKLDLSHATYHGGFFYENCFVLVNGAYSDNVLKVSSMLLPPGETYEDSKSNFRLVNYFGGASEYLLRDSTNLKKQMSETKETLLVFVSDLWLDKSIVFDKLETMFEGFSLVPPYAFILMGNFLSQSYGAETFALLRRLLKKFAELINRFDTIAQTSEFVFVPGQNDPCMMHIIPRIPMPKSVTADFVKLVPKAIFTSNPARLQYCSREIVVYRGDVLAKFMQDCLNKPNKDKIGDFVAKTIVTQGHLSPFSLNVQPVHWDFDSTLHLYPIPNLVVIGDKCNSYIGKYKGCTVANPGAFFESGFTFQTYVPAEDCVDDCAIDD